VAEQADRFVQAMVEGKGWYSGEEVVIRKRTQQEWDYIFDFIVEAIIALMYGFFGWCLDLPWWLTSLVVAYYVREWERLVKERDKI
jgi:hypothetical protein